MPSDTPNASSHDDSTENERTLATVVRKAVDWWRSWRGDNAILLLGIIYPVILALGTSALFNALIPCDVPYFERAEDGYQGKLVESLYSWGMSAVLLMTACSWLIFIGGSMIWRLGVERLQIFALRLTLVAIVVVSIFLFGLGYGGFQNCISRCIILPLVADLPAGNLGGGEDTLDSLMPEILTFVQTLGMAAILVLAIAATIPLMRDGPDNEDTAPKLARQARDLRTLLISGAVALVAVYLSIDTLFAIPEALLPEFAADDTTKNPQIDMLMHYANGLKLFWGIVLSLVLVGIFVVPFIAISRRSQRLVISELPDATPERRQEWLKEKGLVESWQTQITKISAILAPVLTGPFASALAQLPI